MSPANLHFSGGTSEKAAFAYLFAFIGLLLGVLYQIVQHWEIIVGFMVLVMLVGLVLF